MPLTPQEAPQMTSADALRVLDEAASLAPINRHGHATVIRAVHILQEALALPDEVPVVDGDK